MDTNSSHDCAILVLLMSLLPGFVAWRKMHDLWLLLPLLLLLLLLEACLCLMLIWEQDTNCSCAVKVKHALNILNLCLHLAEYTYSEPTFGSVEEFVGLVISVVMTFEILLYTIRVTQPELHVLRLHSSVIKLQFQTGMTGHTPCKTHVIYRCICLFTSLSVRLHTIVRLVHVGFSFGERWVVCLCGNWRLLLSLQAQRSFDNNVLFSKPVWRHCGSQAFQRFQDVVYCAQWIAAWSPGDTHG